MTMTTPNDLKPLFADCNSGPGSKICRYLQIINGACPRCNKEYVNEGHRVTRSSISSQGYVVPTKNKE